MCIAENIPRIRVDRMTDKNSLKPRAERTLMAPRPAPPAARPVIPWARAAKLARNRRSQAFQIKGARARRELAEAHEAWDAALRRYTGAAVQNHLTSEDLEALGLSSSPSHRHNSTEQENRS